MVGPPVVAVMAGRYTQGAVLGGGDSAAGPLTRRAVTAHQVNQVSANLRAISLEYSHTDLAAATHNFHASRRLGSGCYGAVFRGELKDGSEVAIKAIDLGILMGKGECPEDAGFDEEVTMLSKFRHPHLVTLLGWGHTGLNRYLVYEYLPGGDVFQRLHKSKVGLKTFLWHERLSVLLDSATGLSHMHNSTPKAFHRDIKSANILLDRHGTAKMADFGLSCVGQNSANHINVKTIGGTPGYKCPIYERTGRFTEGSEVYSFGMVCLEVITGLDPSASDSKVPGGIAFPIAEQISPNKPGALERCLRRFDVSADWSTALYGEVVPLALRCVSCPDERVRPHFTELVKSLRSLVERNPPNSQQAIQQQPQPPKQQLQQLQQPQQPQKQEQLQPQQKQQQQHQPQQQEVQQQLPPQPSQEAQAQLHQQHLQVQSREQPEAPLQQQQAQQSAAPAPQLQQPQQPQLQQPAQIRRQVQQQQQSMQPVQKAMSMQPPLQQPRAQSPPRLLQTRQVQQFKVISQGPAEPAGHLQQSPTPAAASSASPLHTPCESSASPCESRPKACFKLELEGPTNAEALPIELRCLPLHGSPCAEGLAKMDIGRHLQAQIFEAWLPDAKQRACISRKALEISWTAKGEQAWLEACGTNPMAVDGKTLQKGNKVALKIGSDITFTYEGSVLLRLRFAAAAAQERVAMTPLPFAARAELDMMSPSPTPVARMPLWSTERTHQLNFSNLQRGRENKVILVEGLSAVSEAVERLNAGSIFCPSGFCMVFSSTRSTHFLLFQEHCKDVALRACGIEEDASPPAGHAAELQGATRAVARQSLSWIPPQEAAMDESKSSGSWRLICVRAEGMTTEALKALPSSLLEVQLHEGTTTPLGRHHQLAQFEALLQDPIQRFNISRTHLHLTVQDGALGVTNLSTNLHLYVDKELLPKDASRKLSHGQVLSFTKLDETLLMFQVCCDTNRRSLVQAFQEAGLAESGKAFAPALRQTLGLPASQQPSGAAESSAQGGADGRLFPRLPAPQLPRPSAAPMNLCGDADASPPVDDDAAPAAKFYLPPPVLEQSTAPRAALPVSSDDAEDSEALSPPVILELRGAGVRDLLPEHCRLGPLALGKRPLIVGRRHQKDLLQRAVKEECLDFISRDHFVIAYESGSFLLFALSQNRLWLDRDGCSPMTLAKDEMRSLLPGDRIVLGTGEANAEDSRRRLCWHFHLAVEGGK
mmetsp:Transcript_36175/g.65388  ORF Transcript_36175/g.65388 Transcript_36175/m.65388 type:complete len:1216 (+) Transcript_36175:132-3779(+)